MYLDKHFNELLSFRVAYWSKYLSTNHVLITELRWFDDSPCLVSPVLYFHEEEYGVNYYKVQGYHCIVIVILNT